MIEDFILVYAGFVYASIPILLIITGVSFIISSVRVEPWGNSIDGIGVGMGLILIPCGIVLSVVLYD